MLYQEPGTGKEGAQAEGGQGYSTLVQPFVNETFTQAVYVVVIKRGASFITPFHYLAQSLRGLICVSWCVCVGGGKMCLSVESQDW